MNVRTASRFCRQVSGVLVSACSLLLWAWSPVQAAPGDFEIGMAGYLADPDPDRDVSGRDIAIDAEGRILVAGTVAFRTTSSDAVIFRFRPDGTRDVAFGNGSGRVMTDVPTGSFYGGLDVATDPAGRIVLLGEFTTPPPDGEATFLARYAANGSPDGSFGDLGEVRTPFIATAMAIDGSGRIVVVGRPYSSSDFVVARYGVDGHLDPTFGRALPGSGEGSPVRGVR